MLKYVRKITVHSETQIEQWVIEVSGIYKAHKEEHIRIIALAANCENKREQRTEEYQCHDKVVYQKLKCSGDID